MRLSSLAFMSAFAVLAVSCKTRDYNAAAVESRGGEKNARSNDVASKYVLENDGDFFRYIRGSGAKCQITNNVSEFKVSQHPGDAAMVYFKKNGDLYVLHNAETSGQCPKASTKVIMNDVQEYKNVSDTNTTIVNIALSRGGQLVAWEDNYEVVNERSIRDFAMNQCYNQSGKNFKRYVAFAITNSGYVLKIDGNSPRSSKVDTQSTYRDLSDFKNSNRVCEDANEPSAPPPSNPAPSNPPPSNGGYQPSGSTGVE